MHANQAATPSPSIYREAEADTTPLNAPMGASLVGILLPSLRPGKEQADALTKIIPSTPGEPR